MATCYSHYVTGQRRTRHTGDLAMNRAVKSLHPLEAYFLVRGRGNRQKCK